LEEGKKTCPLCDSEIEAESKVCPSCGVDLTIFDVDLDGELDFDSIKIEDSKSLDELLDEITTAEEIPSDIVEDLKTIGKDNAKFEESEAEEAPEETKESPEIEPEVKPGEERAEVEAEKEEEKFECPTCGTLLPMSSTVCFNCGVEFVEEEVVQFQCPECSTIVTGDVTKCPQCGTAFAEREALPAAKGEAKPAEGAETAEGDPYQTLQNLVEEVKPSLLIARRYEIDVSEGKDLINKAIKASKSKDIKSALEFVRKSRDSVEGVIHSQISDRLAKLKEEIEDAESRGMEVQASEMLEDAQKALNDRKYEASIQSYLKAKENYESFCGDYVKVKEDLDFMNELLKNSTYMRFDVSDGVKYLGILKEAINKSDWTKASKIATTGKEKIISVLPSQIRGEMRKARELLIDWKSKDKDITKPIKHLKEASMAVKSGDHAEALRFLVLFKKETQTL